jgi:imidazolonepropionase-like amidohydrolase
MRHISRLHVLIGVSLALSIGASTVADAQTTALRGSRVIDGRGGAPIDDATVVFRDGRIIAIGPSAATPVPSDAQVVDYTGKTIIPGLISAHSHVGIFVGLKAAPENYSRDLILRQLKQLEAYGVTTVMALGLNGPLFYELRPELHAGRLPGADLFGADQGVGAVGGQPAAAVVPVGENQISRPDTVERARDSAGSLFCRDRPSAQERFAGSGPHLRP